METNTSNSRSGTTLLVVLVIVVFLYGAYYYYTSKEDKTLADQVYNQLLVIDGQLDNLNLTAESISSQKKLNDQIVTEVNQITPNNFSSEKPNLEQLINQINYNPQTAQKFESAITLLGSFNNNPKELKRNLKLLKLAVRELKYQHNQEITRFNQQISVITTQIASIKDEISHIHTDRLQELELAKLKYISKKLSETAHSLQAAFYTNLVDDVLDTVIEDAGAESK